jgi:ATP-dependent helicase/nuclease subunit A
MSNINHNPNYKQKIASNPDYNVWVSASAGTGKTKVLIDRILRLLLKGNSIDKILCITFTKVAAQEMINRLSSILARWSILEDADLAKELFLLNEEEPTTEEISLAKQLFANFIDNPQKINIQTIHSFCQNILNNFPIEANIMSGFKVIEPDYAQELKKQAIESVLNTKIFDDSLEIKNTLTTIVKHISALDFENKISSILNYPEKMDILQDKYNLNIDFESFKLNLYEELKAKQGISAESILQQYFDGSFNKLAFLEIISIAQGTKNKLSASFDINKLFWFLNLPKDEQIKNKDVWEKVFYTTSGSIRKKIVNEGFLKELQDGQALWVKQVIEEELLRLEKLRNEYKNQISAEINLAFMQLAYEIYKAYENIKLSLGVLDFNDLIIKTHKLLNKSLVIPWILYKLDNKISHILVDEAQDTNPLQWDIIRVFVEEFFTGSSSNQENRSIFVVGDVKQSIYSFQGASPEYFNVIKALFKEKVKNAEKIWHQVPMNTSFRSSSGVISAVNHITSNLFSQNDNIYKEEDFTHLAHNQNLGANIEIWPLLVDDNKEEKWRRYKNLATAIVKKIKKLNQDGVSYGDILILYRKREGNPTLNYLVKFLKESEIPVLGVDKLNLSEHLAVNDLIALAKFLLQQNDDFSLACVLKSPIFNLKDDDIFNLKITNSSSLFNSLNQEKYIHIYNKLNKWVSLVDYIPVYDLFFHILYVEKNFTNFLNSFGNEVQDILMEFMNLILQFNERTQSKNISNLQIFLEFITKGDHKISRDSSSKKDMVNLMTIHASKGLESRVVFILNDLDAKSQNDIILYNENPSTPLLLLKLSKDYQNDYTNQIVLKQKNYQLKELARLFYVAITRAKEQLYICSVAKQAPDENEDKANHLWWQILNNAINNNVFFEHNLSALESDFFDEKLGFVTKKAFCISQATPLIKKEIFSQNSINFIPQWCFKEAPKEQNPTKPLSPSKIDFEEKYFSSPLSQMDEKKNNLINKGLLVHKILEQINYLSDYKEIELFINNILNGYAEQLTEQSIIEIKNNIHSLLNKKELMFLWENKGMAEVGISGQINYNNELNIVSARVDKIIKIDNKLWVIDYKYAKKPNLPSKKHIKQMEIYKSILKNIYPECDISGLIIYTQSLETLEV